MRRVAVTGALGAAGRVVSDHLESRGHEVVRIDKILSPDPVYRPSRSVDLADYGDTLANLHGADAVVHLGSEPWPERDFFTGAHRYRNNTIGTFNVFQAACQLGIRRVVWASSETVQGNPFAACRPRRIPILETDEPMPQTAYALSKLSCEQLAHHMHRIHGTVFVGLRAATILHDAPHPYDSYDTVPDLWKDSSLRASSLWKYIDIRDVASAVCCALAAPLDRSDVFNISAADTIMTTPTRALFAQHFPDVPISDELGAFETPVSLAKARRLLDWFPCHSWRDVVSH